jgi:5-methylcytosine-specific restriction endonuclease McrA
VRVCNVCKVDLPAAAFHARRASSDGLSYTCIECHRARQQILYRKNADRVKAQAKAWAAANPQRRLEIVRASAEKHRAKKRLKSIEYNRRMRAERPEHARSLYRAAAQRRRLRAAGAGQYDRRAADLIVQAARGRCTYCDRPSKLTLDHLVPLKDGGTHAWDNLLAACKSCNSSKNASELTDWLYARHGIEGLGRALLATKAARKIMKRLHPAAIREV